MSVALEATNLARAARIRDGTLYAQGTVECNTADFVHYEQTIVQSRLDALRAEDEPRYHREIEFSNDSIGSTWARCIVSVACPGFTNALRAAERELNGPINIARQEVRELLGCEIARRCGKHS